MREREEKGKEWWKTKRDGIGKESGRRKGRKGRSGGDGKGKKGGKETKGEGER